MNVISLFDGMACGLEALKRAEIKVDNYFASEIDKYAIKIAKKNHPEIKHLGNMEFWEGWISVKNTNIDLIIGGSPCQGFSFAGKQLNFDDPRSKLFFVFVDILNFFKKKNPNIKFLLENVKMKKEYQNIITDNLGVEPVLINSALVSAQNRNRLYWCNWQAEQPQDKGILLKDIIDDGYVDRNKSFRLDSNYFKTSNTSPDRYLRKSGRQIVFKKNYLQYDVSGKGHYSQDQRAYYKEGKHGALTSNRCESKIKVLLDRDGMEIRKLSPIECERLQTLPDNYTEGVSNTQRYKMIGNGWTVDVVVHLFKEMLNNDHIF